ncbi:MAG: hypothetical protein M3P43_10110 [Actinomycetota bacterium]|nr:hypothetical protein [Actinomycetota bacterium]
MAIKSKGKTKARPASKGPRHGPVPVPKPFAQRRWVQLTALFIAGILVMTVFVWATNGLRRERASTRAASDLASRQQALSKWKAILEPQITAVGQLKGDIPPTVASDVTAAVTALASGQTTTTRAGALASSAKELRTAARAIDTFDLAGTITEQGFDAASAAALTASKAEIVEALHLYQQAAELGALALSSPKHLEAQLAEHAKAVLDSAATLLQASWNKYASTLRLSELSAGGSPGVGTGLSGG